jgi:hypothetical protein
VPDKCTQYSLVKSALGCAIMKAEDNQEGLELNGIIQFYLYAIFVCWMRIQILY